jgi:hypothetical protein
MNPDEIINHYSMGGVQYTTTNRTNSSMTPEDRRRLMELMNKTYNTGPMYTPAVGESISQIGAPQEVPDGWSSIMDGQLLKCPTCKGVVEPDDVRDHEMWHVNLADPI